ncbi:hypothetical protein C0585_01225 [Candidatus Woesearchaeota archaeon]|nr:MAG: hypothetical protein C0585_01225 [Candidatus Woesearchaeota archaeon]
MDVLIPKGNEKELIDMSKRLGETELVFLYSLKEYKKKEISKEKGLIIHKGLLINESEINKIPECEYVFLENPNRSGFEAKKVNHLFNIEDQKKIDFIHHRNSGLNQVLAKEMKNIEKKLCFSYNLLLKSNNKNKILGRFKQNKKICNKYKINIECFSFASEPYELRQTDIRKALIKIL